MENRDPKRFIDVNNMFALCVLSNNEFEDYAKYAKEFGHPDSMTKEQVQAYSNALNDLKENNFEIYKRFYTKLYTLILEDNLNSEGSPYNIFDRVRKFGYYIGMIMNKEGDAEKICEMYEEKEQLDTKLISSPIILN